MRHVSIAANAAAPYMFVENGGTLHTDLSAPRKIVSQTNAKRTACQVANGGGFHYLEADVSAREGVTGAAKLPPCSHRIMTSKFPLWEIHRFENHL